jgi:hypothetical protein
MSTTINTAKELAAPAHRPLLLAVFTFADASVLRVSTMAVTFGGNAYAARIDQTEIDRLAVLSEQGVDRVPSVTVRLADPDGYLWTNYERASGKGFSGAAVSLTFAVYDPVNEEFSTDSFVPFLGTCDKPGLDAQYLTVAATSRLNLTRYSLPSALIQPNRCMWINPATVAQRSEAGSVDSRFYRCGETRDLTTAPPCSYIKGTCTQPDRFSGLTWEPEKSASGKSYLSGQKIEWRNADTSEKFRSYVPLWLGGSCWLEAVVANQFADGNYTRGEAIIGMGAIAVDRVIVNGHELAMSRTGDYRWHYVNDGDRDGSPNTDAPYNSNGDGYPSQTAIQFLAPHAVISPDSRASVRVLGRRSSLRVARRIISITSGVVTFDGANQDCAGNSPFTITIVGNSNGALNSTFGLTSWAYGPPGTVTLSGTTASGTGGYCYYEHSGVVGSLGGASTPWALAEALMWARFDFAEIDLLAWADVAKICNADYTYTDQNGSSGTQARFSTAMALRERRSAADVVRGLRQAMGALLVPGSDGLLRLQIEGPLAEQQPAAVDGSNYNTAVSSTTRGGTTTNGYLAYVFDESNSWDLAVESRPLAETPNRVQFQFSDPANGFAVSTFALVDPDSVARTGQETPGGLQVEPEGIASHNHALRVAKLGLAKLHRGNPAGDARGTDWFRWSTSFRGCRLRIGDIVGITNSRLGLTRQQVRITEIKPSKGFGEIQLKGHYHSDAWYLDSTGSTADPLYSTGREFQRGIPAPWQPNQQAPTATGSGTYDKPGSFFDSSDGSFSLAHLADISADGAVESRLEIVGKCPVTRVASLSTPLLARQGTTANTGGTIPGAAGITGGIRRLYVAIAARDSGGLRTAMSEPCIVDITDTGNVNTATVGITSWDPDSTGYFAYAGWSPLDMSLVADALTTPSSITITSLDWRGEAPPDVLAARLRLEARECYHAGVWAALVTAVGGSTITCSDLVDATDDWDDRDVSVIGDASAGAPGVWNFRATGYVKATGEFTVSPSPGSVAVGDVLVIRAQATTASSTEIGDSGFINKFAASGMADRTGLIVRIIAGKGRGQERRIASNTGTVLTVAPEWEETPDSTSRFVVLAADPEFSTETAIPQNADPDAEITIRLAIANRLKRVLSVRATVLDSEGRASSDRLAPVRDIYLYGSRGPGDSYTVEAPSGGEVLADVADGTRAWVLTADIAMAVPVFTGGVVAAGTMLALKATQDSTGGWSIDWTTAGVFAGTSVLGDYGTGPDPSTYSKFFFTYNGTKWELDSFILNVTP